MSSIPSKVLYLSYVFHDWMISYGFRKSWFRSMFFALYIMFIIWYWLERGQSGLFIQIHFTASVFLSAITTLLYILIIDLIFTILLYNLFSHYFCWIFYDIYVFLENVFELKEGNIYRCCWRHSSKKAGWTRWCFFCDF